MARRVTCDLCGQHAPEPCSVDGIPKADEDGDGFVKEHFDVCRGCYRKWLAWMREQRGSGR